MKCVSCREMLWMLMYMWILRTRECIATWPQNSSLNCSTVCWSLIALPRPLTPIMNREPRFGRLVSTTDFFVVRNLRCNKYIHCYDFISPHIQKPPHSLQATSYQVRRYQIEPPVWPNGKSLSRLAWFLLLSHIKRAHCVSMCVFRFQREVEAQSAETGDQQPGVWPAYPLPHVHRPEQAGRLGGGAEETAQVRHHCHVRDWNRCALRPCGHVNIFRLITCSKLLLSFVHGTVHIFPCPCFSFWYVNNSLPLYQIQS